jgi:ectoine hydroxylase-related dioxygenase (phytanoyl-CoA dioxygenase family)
MITLWMPLIDLSPEMGSLEFASGSHSARRIDAFDPTDVNAAISDQTQRFFDAYIRDHEIVITSNGAMSAGDASFHDGWVLHRAEGNRTSSMREVMTILYMADGANTLEADNPGAQEAYEVELVGLKPGEPAAGPRNPLVYSKDS